MGRSYSLQGYLIAVLQRSAKTLLVEGISDSEIIHRQIIENSSGNIPRFNIDTVSIISDDSVNGQGNRDKIVSAESFFSLSENPRTNSLPSLFSTLKDREWQGNLSFHESICAEWREPEYTANRHITKGHSIENYFFDYDCVYHFLKHRYSQHLNTTFIDLLKCHFDNIMLMAAFVSHELKSNKVITRFSGINSSKIIELKNGKLQLSQEFTKLCLQRSIVSASNIRTKTNTFMVASDVSKIAKKEQLRWISHGHTGEQIIWSAVGCLAVLSGIAPTVSEQISSGHASERQLVFSGWLSNQPANYKEPLSKICNWLTCETA